MSILQRIADPWLEWIVAVSWQLALLVCIVAVVCRLARGASPRWRRALWLVVLAKVFLPPGLTAPWSLGQWGVAPALARAQWLAPVPPDPASSEQVAESMAPDAGAATARPRWLADWNPSLAEVSLVAWASGARRFGRSRAGATRG